MEKNRAIDHQYKLLSYDSNKLVFSNIVVFGAGLNCYKSMFGDFCLLSYLWMINANSHFCTLKYPLTMYTILFAFLNLVICFKSVLLGDVPSSIYSLR